MNPYSRAAKMVQLARKEANVIHQKPVKLPQSSSRKKTLCKDIDEDIFRDPDEFVCSTPNEKGKTFTELQPVTFNQAETENEDANRTYTVLPEFDTDSSCSQEVGEAVDNQDMPSSDQENNDQQGQGKRKKKRSKAEMNSDVLLKKKKLQESHFVRPGCDRLKCPLECHSHFQASSRQNINVTFWSKTADGRKQFLREMIVLKKPSSTRKISNSRKTTARVYRLRDATGEYKKVCQTFFLNTLGQLHSNDKMIRTAFKTVELSDQSNSSGECLEVPDRRGCPKKFDHDLIKTDIENYSPSIPHYRREHAPNRRYLSCELTIKEMHRRFVTSTGLQCSYPLYQQIFKSMNIGMTKLGHEECELCKEFELHKKCCNCDVVCSLYSNYAAHRKRYTEARQRYREDAAAEEDPQKQVFSADLQKVLLLPMIDQFKKTIFTSRLVCFNETFAPLSKSAKKSIAILWHEAVCGRKDEDIASAFQKFISEYRDCEEIIIWADNCPGQNKNWTLFTMLCDLVNSSDVRLATLKIKFFEPGHSFMSADSTHSAIESVIKRRKTSIQDYVDLQSAIKDAGCKVIDMQVPDFRNFFSGLKSVSKENRKGVPYLADIVHAEFRRGSQNLFFKTSHSSQDLRESSFLKTNHDASKATIKSSHRGVSKTKKDLIIKNLVPLMDEHKKPFWMLLPTSNESADLLSVPDVTPAVS